MVFVACTAGAATFRILSIVKMLNQGPMSTERSPWILLQACKALHGRHHPVVDLLWPHLSDRERARDPALSHLDARYANSAIVVKAYKHWNTHREPSGGMKFQEVPAGIL